jgi:hypothetical protein
MPHPPYSPEISPCDFWLFVMLKQILRDREFSSSDEIEDAIAQMWNHLTFDDVQSAFRNWIRRLAWVSDNGEYRGITKSLRWEAVEDLRIHRIHLSITQEEVNKSFKYKIVSSSLCLIIVHFAPMGI